LLLEKRGGRIQQGLIAGGLVAALLLLVWAADLFMGLRLTLTNTYFVPEDVPPQIVIVALDDQSLQRYGRSPLNWPRSVYTDLVHVLDAAGARIVAFDLLFSEPSPDDASFAAALQQARQSDSRLRAVLAATGVNPGLPATDLPDFPNALKFENVLLPTATLVDAVDYLGFVNTYTDVDGVVRRQPSLLDVGGQPALSWSMAVYLAYLRVPGAALTQVIESDGAALHIAGGQTVHVDSLGMWLQHFYGPPPHQDYQTFPIYSLVDVLAGRVAPAEFDDRIVLVGLLNSAGAPDRYAVPSAASGQQMNGVEIQANAIMTLIRGDSLRWLPDGGQALLIGLTTILTSLLYMHLRWYVRFAAWGVLVLLGVFAAALAFSLDGVVISLLDTGLALTLPVAVTLGLEVTNEINRRRRFEFLLDSMVRVSQQRLMLDKTLPQIAASIQQVIPGAAVLIWQWEAANGQPLLVYPAGDLADDRLQQHTTLAGQVARSNKCVIQHNHLTMPVAWQSRMVGVLAVTDATGRAISKDVSLFLRGLADRLAPHLENAFLYTQVERQRAVQDATLRGSPAGVLVLDHDLHLDRASQAIELMFGIDAQAIRGAPVIDLLTMMGTAESARQEIAAQFAQGESFQLEIKVDKTTVNFAAAPQDVFHLWVVVITDITQIIQLSELKTYIIRMLSHDLGNPLSRILGYSSLLVREEGISESAQEFLNYIINDGEEMSRIIEDVLNLEHLRAGQIVFETVDLCHLVTELVERFRPEAALRQHTLSVDIPDAPCLVKGNHRQLAQAAMNLLNNAIKYTPDGGVITFSVAEVDGQVRLAVVDNGYGIPEAAQPNIFREFYRVKSGAVAGIPGTGLGLSLVKVVTENHHGRVWFESEEGIGSTFYVELPIMD
jgi:signal transduction histidine kinase/CHASE2 domain-containing sensor protein